ncbi:TPA: quinolinate synthase [candidate division WOR-3 bacterium]|jgi:quinolinate synthase|uniref:Quinolinate synthase n=1 Tax=candidate division WOR-3 bacterium TaxID=2052148 RepID=A0A350H972_UNCW3|nr:quinolinate synthase [candidate division WOR-3 bacterium]
MGIQSEIIRLKKKKNITILSHNYQKGEIQDIADFVGDSLELAKMARGIESSKILFAGVRFMAETAKILSPEKRVILPVIEAGCEMADMVDIEALKRMKSKNPKAAVVAYVNTTAEVKALSDICCTSANAVKIVNSLTEDEIIFLPDKNLAAFVQRQTSKKIIPYNGWCYVHDQINENDISRAREKYPNAILFIHPEARERIQLMADYVLSTGGMVKKAGELGDEEFIVGTEEGMIYRLKRLYPEKKFYALRDKPALRCVNMKKTRIEDIKIALKEESPEITLDSSVIESAGRAIERMLKLS